MLAKRGALNVSVMHVLGEHLQGLLLIHRPQVYVRAVNRRCYSGNGLAPGALLLDHPALL